MNETTSAVQKRLSRLSSREKRELLAQTLRESLPRSRAPAGLRPSPVPAPFSSSFKVEERPLLTLFAEGEIAEVDSAAIGYLPNTLLDYTGLSREEVVQDWCDNVPVFFGLLDTFLGRVADIRLPLFEFELYAKEKNLVQSVIEALHLAKRLGARTVSPMGLTRSTTNYLRTVAAAIADRKDLLAISMGHATSTAAVVLVIAAALRQAGRTLGGEQVGFVGLGSVGLDSLELMVRRLPHPAEIILCDVYRKHELLEEIRRKLIDELEFRGSVRVAESRNAVPSELYNATLIVGSTNVPDILDVDRMKPGTIIVDDSVPPCFATERAIGRFQRQEDILFAEVGMLRFPHPFELLIYWPKVVDQFRPAVEADLSALYHLAQSELPSCILSSLLSSRFDDLKPAAGASDSNTSLQHYDMLNDLGFQPADLQCEGYVLPKKGVLKFHERFGSLHCEK